jgi:hypothetical protein
MGSGRKKGNLPEMKRLEFQLPNVFLSHTGRCEASKFQQAQRAIGASTLRKISDRVRL